MCMSDMKPPSPEVWELRRKIIKDEPINSLKCNKCGMIFSGSMLYCCQNNECPIQMKTIC